tara:strand:+ start:59 stop:205 length:147 start_codon:yes stop_codon:yes gene_type:complete
MNTREEILAEINMLRAMVSKLWEDKYGSINGTEWEEFRKNTIKKMKNN